jgi:hypothetical protein
VIFLTLSELLHVAERTLGPDYAVRDYGLPEAALARPQATVFGKDAYPDLDATTSQRNFNGLTMRDVDRAKSFYGDVFGWTTLSIPSGDFWILPGYGDYLEKLTPGIRAMTAELGAPASRTW